jgi:hypothetical protein
MQVPPGVIRVPRGWCCIETSGFGIRPALARCGYKKTLIVFSKIEVYWMSLRKGLGQGFRIWDCTGKNNVEHSTLDIECYM